MKKHQTTILLGLAILLWTTSGLSQEVENQVPLEDELREAAKRIAPGWKQVGEIYCNPLNKPQTDELPIELEGSKCYAFIALARKGITDLSLSIYVGDKEVAHDRITGDEPTARWCAPSPVDVVAKLTAYSGSGEYAFGVFAETKSTTQRADKVGGQTNDLIANRIRQLHSRFGKGRAAITSVLKGNLETGQSTIFKIKLTKGHCYTAIGAGELSSRDLNLKLLDAKGREMATDSTNSCFASLDTEPCIKKTGEYQIKVTMAKGSGQFGLQVFSD